MHDATAYVEALQQQVERLKGDLELAERVRTALEAECAALERLNTIGRTITAELDHQRLAQTVVDAAIELTGARFGALFYDVAGKALGAQVDGAIHTVTAAPRDAFAGLPMPRNTLFLSPALLGHATVRVGDVALDPRYGKNYPHRGLPEGHPSVRSYLAVPVVSRSGVVFGAVMLGHPEPDVFTEGAECVTVELAAYAATAMANARVHAEAQRLIAALEKTNAELDQFTYAASHDLRAPLRGITNLASWVDEDLPATTEPTVREHLRLLKVRATRMDRLISGLLELSRVGRSRDKPERVDLSELVHETIQLTRPPAAARIMMVGELPTFSTERAALQQVFQHLIANAVQHAERDDVVIRISAVDRGDSWELVIADNGVGIKPEHHDRIWQMFQTLRARDLVETTGIGLAIVRKQVEGHGGQVWIDPDVSIGATFRFTWPKRAT